MTRPANLGRQRNTCGAFRAPDAALRNLVSTCQKEDKADEQTLIERALDAEMDLHLGRVPEVSSEAILAAETAAADFPDASVNRLPAA
jgi:hypothetical protein